MKKSYFYWNWLARVAKVSNPQRNVAMKTTTTMSKMNGKTVILAVATILVVALTTQTTGPLAEIPELPDLPDPPAITGPYFPPFPPGVMSCSAQWNSRRATISQDHANWQKAIERAYYAKRKPFYDAQDAIFDEQDEILAQIEKLNEEWIRLSMSPNSGSAASVARMKQISAEFRAKSKEIEKLQEKIGKISERLEEIEDWRKKWLAWAGEKRLKSIEAADAEYQDCLANERDDD